MTPPWEGRLVCVGLPCATSSCKKEHKTHLEPDRFSEWRGPQVRRNELSESILCPITSELNKSHKSLKSQFPPWHAELLYLLNGEKYLMVLLSGACHVQVCSLSSVWAGSQGMHWCPECVVFEWEEDAELWAWRGGRSTPHILSPVLILEMDNERFCWEKGNFGFFNKC